MCAAFCALAPIGVPEKSLSGGIPHGDTVRTSGADISRTGIPSAPLART